jgi:hypothetical protein
MCTFHQNLARFVMASGVLLVQSVSAGERELRPLGGSVRVEPMRVAGATLEGDRIVMTTPWFDYEPGVGTRSQWAWTWDSFEADTPNPAFGRPAGGYPACHDPPEMRWYFGPAFDNPYTSRDMLECVAGTPCEGVFFAWFWAVGGAGTSEQCFIYVETFEDWSGCSEPNPGSGALGGVIYDFGVLAANVEDGRHNYYYAAIDLSPMPFRHPMPLDGAGGFQIRYGRAYDPESGTFTLPTLCQSMLWATGDAEIPHDGRIGTQGYEQYDDCYPPDGQFSLPFECYDYLFGLCQYTLGPCVGFSARIGEECACEGDVAADGVIDLADLSQLLSEFGRPTPEIPNPCADIDQSGEVDLADLGALLSRLGSSCP